MPWGIILAAVIQYAPEAISAVIAAFKKTQPTSADWAKLFDDAEKVAADFIAKETAALAALPPKP